MKLENVMINLEEKIKRVVNIKNTMVNVMPLADGNTALVVHIILIGDCRTEHTEVLKLLDKRMTSLLPDEFNIVGYKKHLETFVSSPTTAKNRTGYIKEIDGYHKVIDRTMCSMSLSDGKVNYMVL